MCLGTGGLEGVPEPDKLRELVPRLFLPISDTFGLSLFCHLAPLGLELQYLSRLL